MPLNCALKMVEIINFMLCILTAKNPHITSQTTKSYSQITFFRKIFYLFLFLERGEEKEEGEKRQCVVASCVPPYWGPDLQPRPVP